MNNRQIIKDILVEELSKCNNFNYRIEIGNLNLIVNTNKLNHILIDNSSWFEGVIDSEWLFSQYENKYFYISYVYFFSKIEDKIKLKYDEIKSDVKDVLEETFKIKGITPVIPLYSPTRRF